jgi:hypothetical protein
LHQGQRGGTPAHEVSLPVDVPVLDPPTDDPDPLPLPVVLPLPEPCPGPTSSTVRPPHAAPKTTTTARLQWVMFIVGFARIGPSHCPPPDRSTTHAGMRSEQTIEIRGVRGCARVSHADRIVRSLGVGGPRSEVRVGGPIPKSEVRVGGPRSEIRVQGPEVQGATAGHASSERLNHASGPVPLTGGWPVGWQDCRARPVRVTSKRDIIEQGRTFWTRSARFHAWVGAAQQGPPPEPPCLDPLLSSPIASQSHSVRAVCRERNDRQRFPSVADSDARHLAGRHRGPKQGGDGEGPGATQGATAAPASLTLTSKLHLPESLAKCKQCPVRFRAARGTGRATLHDRSRRPRSSRRHVRGSAAAWSTPGDAR